MNKMTVWLYKIFGLHKQEEKIEQAKKQIKNQAKVTTNKINSMNLYFAEGITSDIAASIGFFNGKGSK